MPSLQQLRYEHLADAVVQAQAPSLFVKFFTDGQEELEALVEVQEGRQLELTLVEVDLEQSQLICRDGYGAGVRLPLSQVKAVWWRRRLIHRSLSLWGAGVLAGTLGGAGGALAAAIAGALALRWLGDHAFFYKWIPLYEAAA